MTPLLRPSTRCAVIGKAAPIVTVYLLGIAAIACLFAHAADTQPSTTPAAVLSPRVAALSAQTNFPDPFTFADGSRLTSPKQWPQRRRELLALFLRYQYGAPPPPSPVMAQGLSVHPSTQPAISDASVHEIVVMMGPVGQIKTRLVLTIPAGGAHAPRFPVIVRGDLGWGPVAPEVAVAVIKRGYILAEFDRTMIAADKAGRGNGIYLAYPDFNGGDLTAWAWGYSRIIDYLLTRPDIDPQRIVITGLSRGGKATLLAGALDERVALTVPASSGTGGCAAYRIQTAKSETLHAITKRFPYWFVPDFGEFAPAADRLPFDQHELIATIAPRAFLETAALGDWGANPPGTDAAFRGAKPVFVFLKVGDKAGIAWRPGKHEQNLIDWTGLLDFADWQLFGVKPNRSFDASPFPDAKLPFSWKAPQ